MFYGQGSLLGGNGRVDSVEDLVGIVHKLRQDGDVATSATADGDALVLHFDDDSSLAITGFGALAGTPFDAAEAFARETTSRKRGAPEGADGIDLVSLTDDEIVFEVDGREVVIGGDEAAAILEGAAGATRLWDARSNFSMVDAENGAFFAGSLLGDLVGLFSRGTNDAAAVLDAALTGDERLGLLGLDGDSFAVQVTSDHRGAVDTILFVNAESAIAQSEADILSLGI